MILFRPHRGSLEAALKEVKEFHSKEDFVNHLKENFSDHFSNPEAINLDSVEINFQIKDERTGWDTYIVTIKGENGVLGFTNGTFSIYPKPNQPDDVKTLLWNAYMVLDHGDMDERLNMLEALEQYFDKNGRPSNTLS